MPFSIRILAAWVAKKNPWNNVSKSRKKLAKWWKILLANCALVKELLLTSPTKMKPLKNAMETYLKINLAVLLFMKPNAKSFRRNVVNWREIWITKIAVSEKFATKNPNYWIKDRWKTWDVKVNKTGFKFEKFWEKRLQKNQIVSLIARKKKSVKLKTWRNAQLKKFEFVTDCRRKNASRKSNGELSWNVLKLPKFLKICMNRSILVNKYIFCIV